MKLISCEFENRLSLGIVQGDEVLLPEPASAAVGLSMLELIERFPNPYTAADEILSLLSPIRCVAYSAVKILAPIPQPRQNVLCLGWNYSEHIAETVSNPQLSQQELPKYPIVFTKDVTSVNGPYSDIPYDPSVSEKMDWEAELAFVIGKTAHKVQPQDALDHVFGYTVINDISARDLQKKHRQFFLAKSLPGACPMGPSLVTADEIKDPQALHIESRVNGEIKQDSSTAYQIFGVADLVVKISHILPLLPGTIIATGTPSGVGYVRKPPEYLTDGDVVECEVEGIGCIRNTMVAVTANTAKTETHP